MGLFLKEKELLPLISQKRKGNKLVFTNGCFDLLHVGHIRYLKEAKSLGDILVVGLNSDSSVKGLKGELRPVQNEQDRGEILAAIECVDFVCLFDEATPLRLIQNINPDVLVKGGDWPIDKIVGADHVQKQGGLVKTLQFVSGRSTSLIMQKIVQLG
ncbi:MAG: D-glycero-beta-D-manno-heptose 1-phosphate adenylyltransferase [Bdellovibrionales bacterium]|nr:D-glycero-beta-D-manno-heptose 1-phosphate adenylyltransferase [Bdellovibrionales bacterium]